MMNRIILLIALFPLYLHAIDREDSKKTSKSVAKKENKKQKAIVAKNIDSDKKKPVKVISADTPDALIKAQSALTGQNYSKALKFVSKIKKNVDERFLDQVYFIEGVSYFKLHKFQSAKNSLERSLMYRARNSDALYYLGKTLQTLGFIEQSLFLLKESVWLDDFVELTPGPSYLTLAQIYQTKGESEESAKYFELAMQYSAEKNDMIVPLVDYYINQDKHFESARLISTVFAKATDEEPVSKELVSKYISSTLLVHPPIPTFLAKAKELTLTNIANTTSEKERKSYQLTLAKILIKQKDIEEATKTLQLLEQENIEVIGLYKELEVKKKLVEIANLKNPKPLESSDAPQLQPERLDQELLPQESPIPDARESL